MSYRYMCNFSLIREAVPLLGAGLVGGALYGGTYVGAKNAMGENLSDEATKREVGANTAAATVSGIGAGVTTGLLAKIMMRKGAL